MIKDAETLTMALVGYERKRSELLAQIAAVRQQLGKHNLRRLMQEPSILELQGVVSYPKLQRLEQTKPNKRSAGQRKRWAKARKAV